ncbi:acetyl-CoA C-acetyltransferase [Vulcanisaeta distributa]|uniref:acetyl-CoA C-acetyltransferase n=1 Tax=Vulcanisaeta distributa TaxID=164451 RepID=UPI0006D1467E|nr:acetyl-CoA C-acetyltransferase [Vulcanisaeta distributa]
MGEDREVYVVYFKRTAFSRVKREDPKFDVFYDISGPTLFSRLLVKAVQDLGIKPEQIDHVIVGNALQGGDNWSMGGRIPVFLAKFPVTIPAMAVDMQCASSFDAIGIGTMEIWTGQADIVFAGGYEHMSRVPMYNNPYIVPHLELATNPEYAMYDMATGYVMGGLTAEKLAALKKISREEMDRWSYRSHMLATKAYEEGYFKDEILPIEVVKDGQKIVVDRDLSVRPNTSLEALAKLPPAFKPGGVITAGNSAPPLNSGASLVVLMSGKMVKELGLKPLARVVSLGWAAVDPSIMGEGPVPASKKALAKAGLRVEDIDLWEINEAFAVVTLNAIKELGIDENKVNLKGGAIAIGHPLGATGARLVGTLARQLQLTGKEYGLATACVGGGQGYAIIIQRA